MTKQQWIKAFKEAIANGDSLTAVISNRMTQRDTELWHEGSASRNVNAWQEALKTMFGDYVTVHVYGWMQGGPEVMFPDRDHEPKLRELEEKFSWYAVYIEHSQRPEIREPLTEKQANKLYTDMWENGTSARVFQFKAGLWYDNEGEEVENPHSMYAVA